MKSEYASALRDRLIGSHEAECYREAVAFAERNFEDTGHLAVSMAATKLSEQYAYSEEEHIFAKVSTLAWEVEDYA